MTERDNIDDLLRDNLEEFSMTPPVELWDSIEASLKIKRSRKIMSRVLVGAASVAAVVALFFTLNNGSDIVPNTMQPNTMQQAVLSPQTPSQTPSVPSTSTSAMSTSTPAQKQSTPAISSSTQKPSTSPMSVTSQSTPASTSSANSNDRSLEGSSSGVGSVDDVASETDNKDADKAADQDAKSDPKVNGVSDVAASNNKYPSDSKTVAQSFNQPVLSQNHVALSSNRSHNSSKSNRSNNKGGSWSVGAYTSNFGGSTNAINPSKPVRIAVNTVSEFGDINAKSGGVLTVSGEKLNHKMPLTFGLSVRKSLLKRLSVESGVVYTYLESALTNSDFGVHYRQHLHYIGVPLSVSYDFVSVAKFDFYTMATVMAEKCVAGNYKKSIESKSSPTVAVTDEKISVKDIQMSTALSVGANYNITRHFGVYLEPSLNYYFATAKQPKSYRTDRPLSFNLRLGVRTKF